MKDENFYNHSPVFQQKPNKSQKMR